MGGGVHHSAVDGHLRDIPAWFGPLVALTSVYLTGVDFADGGPSKNAKARSATLLTVTSRAPSHYPNRYGDGALPRFQTR